MDQPETVQEILAKVTDQICEEYCKYPEIISRKHTDEDQADEDLFEIYCKKCPLNRLM